MMEQNGKEKPGQLDKEQLEHNLANALTEGVMAEADPDEAALHRLSPRYVARAQAERDPIVEETKLVREVVREVDDRYDEYMARAGANEGKAGGKAGNDDGSGSVTSG